ncbi:MAG: PLP-dependent aminotransferase family protein [Pseudomonadota bacterium]
MRPFDALISSTAPAPVARFSGLPEFNFVGGHNDPDVVPVADLAETAARVIAEQGHQLATYGLDSGPLGHYGLRHFVAEKLSDQRGIAGGPDDVLITSGSLQALDLVNALFLEPGDTVVVEQFTYGGMLTRLARQGVRVVGAPLDHQGLDVDALATMLEAMATDGVRPKYVYTIPTIQNPTATVLPVERRRRLLALAARFGFLVFEDECYADLLWEGDWPPALRGMPGGADVVHVGSFSKSLAPALRLGYVSAPWPVLSRLLALKTDGGTAAIEQMIVADYFARSFDAHVRGLKCTLAAKANVLMDALAEQFGTAAEFAQPAGGIFLWVKLPDVVDTKALEGPALAEGVAFNPGAEWSAEPAAARSHLRLCYALRDVGTLRDGIAKLAEVCHRETGVPERGANLPRQ